MRSHLSSGIFFAIAAVVFFLAGRLEQEDKKKEARLDQEFIDRLDGIIAKLDSIQSRVNEISYQLPVALPRHGILCALPMNPGEACTALDSMKSKINPSSGGTRQKVIAGSGAGTRALLLPGYTISVSDPGIVQLIEGTGDGVNKTAPATIEPCLDKSGVCELVLPERLNGK